VRRKISYPYKATGRYIHRLFKDSLSVGENM
jgi:hypothetical protein